ncbi:MAG: TadE/TadG family type IV pilus assembly protein [Candidatus Limnocylindrales bacterium]
MSALRTAPSERGQALVEFSLAILVFLVMLVAVFDLGRGVYTFNGVSEAAREIARITATHVGNPVGTNTATVNRIDVQRRLVPDMGTPVFACTDLYGAPVADEKCNSGNYVKVTVTASYAPISLLGMLGPVTLSSTSSVQVP